MRQWPRSRQPDAGTTGADRPGDPEIVIAARADSSAFSPLYERYLDDLLRYCYSRLGNWDDAADAAQQVFVNALAGLPNFVDRGDSFRFWLFTIARHEVDSMLRRRTRRAEDPLLDHDMMEDGAPSPEARAVITDDLDQLRGLLKTLPEGQRLVVLHRLAGQNDHEIAKTLQMSEGAVRTAQSRAIGRLRRLMNVTADQRGGRNG